MFFIYSVTTAKKDTTEQRLKRHNISVFLNENVTYEVMWRNNEWSTKSQIFRFYIITSRKSVLIMRSKEILVSFSSSVEYIISLQ